ncbi:hypothetical protein A2U01_0069923, partial [Trifolium medium]|nr:hypothetical protein [Trifolium medium]
DHNQSFISSAAVSASEATGQNLNAHVDSKPIRSSFSSDAKTTGETTESTESSVFTSFFKATTAGATAQPSTPPTTTKAKLSWLTL